MEPDAIQLHTVLNKKADAIFDFTWSSRMRTVNCAMACPTGKVIFPLSGLRSSAAGFGPSEIWSVDIHTLNFHTFSLKHFYTEISLCANFYKDCKVERFGDVFVCDCCNFLSPESSQSRFHMFPSLWSEWLAQNVFFLSAHRQQSRLSAMQMIKQFRLIYFRFPLLSLDYSWDMIGWRMQMKRKKRIIKNNSMTIKKEII